MVAVTAVATGLDIIPGGVIIREIIIAPIIPGCIPILLTVTLLIAVTEHAMGQRTRLTNTVTKSWTEAGLV